MKFGGKQANCLISLFRGFKEVPGAVPFAVQLNSSDVTVAPFIVDNAFVPSRVVALFSTISMIFGRCSLAQIIESIIPVFFVDVINFVFWPFACHPDPNNAMGEVCFTQNAEFDTSKVVLPTSNITSVGTSGHRDAPSQFSGVWRVIKDFLEVSLGEIVAGVFVSHTISYHTRR